nr:unnamed protein product [Callosobruchus analis]
MGVRVTVESFMIVSFIPKFKKMKYFLKALRFIVEMYEYHTFLSQMPPLPYLREL